jgi:DNA mismatch repair protein MutS
LAVTDVVTALATVAANHGYVRPVLHQGRGIHLVDGRHPMVEDANPGRFVPNNANLSGGQNLVLLTGPNMAGKSTYMRQVALIVLMAHMGSFVPAQAAKIGKVDRIFTRIGASDDLSAGQSTFMVEMVELAQILHQATDRSLVLLDEIGRGTSTYDGMSIAEAVLETLQSSGMKPLTLFATHYHELSETVERLSGATNCSVAVEETETGIAFLHTVVPRPADRSYGIQVARLAGIPEVVIGRAMELLQLRENTGHAQRDIVPQVQTSLQFQKKKNHSVSTTGEAKGELKPLFIAPYYDLAERLAGTDINQYTPLAALNLLNELIKQAQGVVAWDKFK